MQPLAQRMVRDERLELGHELEMTRKGEIGLDPLFDRRQAQLLEPRDLALGERLVRDVGECRAPPEAERFSQQRGRVLGGSGGQLAATLRHEPLELLEVELPRSDVEAVTRAFGRDAFRPEPLSEGVHLDLQRGLLAQDRAFELS